MSRARLTRHALRALLTALLLWAVPAKSVHAAQSDVAVLIATRGTTAASQAAAAASSAASQARTTASASARAPARVASVSGVASGAACRAITGQRAPGAPLYLMHCVLLR